MTYLIGGGGSVTTLTEDSAQLTANGAALDTASSAVALGSVLYDTRVFYDPGTVEEKLLLPPWGTRLIEGTPIEVNTESATWIQDATVFGHFSTAPNLGVGVIQGGLDITFPSQSVALIKSVAGDGTAPSSVELSYARTSSAVSITGIQLLISTQVRVSEDYFGGWIRPANIWYFMKTEYAGYSDTYLGIVDLQMYLMGTNSGDTRFAFSWDDTTYYYHNSSSWVVIDPTDRTEWIANKGQHIIQATSGYQTVLYSDDSGPVTETDWDAFVALRTSGQSLWIWFAELTNGSSSTGISQCRLDVKFSPRRRPSRLSEYTPSSGGSPTGVNVARWSTTTTLAEPVNTVPENDSYTLVVEVRDS